MERFPECEEVHALARMIEAPYGIVVPAYDESTSDVMRLLRSIDQQALVVCVVNRNEKSAAHAQASNRRLMNDLKAAYSLVQGHDSLSLLRGSGLPKMLLINRSDERLISSIGGVGEARNLGASVLCELMDLDHVQSEWIHQTDADSTLPADYFTKAEERYEPQRSALCMRGVRCDAFGQSPEFTDTTKKCEISGRLYFFGWQLAGSPWALLPTGCGIAVSRWAYRRVGGIQHYVSTEDWHLISSAARVGIAHRIYGEGRVQIESRPVSRPASGHGSALSEITANGQQGLRPVITSASVWQHITAIYGAINACILTPSKVSSEQWALDAGRDFAVSRYPKAVIDTKVVSDITNRFVGPIEFLKTMRGSAPEKYVSLHCLFDMRRCMIMKEAVKVLVGSSSMEDALEQNPLGNLSKMARSASIEDIQQECYKLEEIHCSSDMGPHALAEKLLA